MSKLFLYQIDCKNAYVAVSFFKIVSMHDSRVIKCTGHSYIILEIDEVN